MVRVIGFIHSPPSTRRIETDVMKLYVPYASGHVYCHPAAIAALRGLEVALD